MQLKKISILLAIGLLISAASTGVATPRVSDPISGKYEGVAKSAEIGDIPITVEIKSDNNKISGKLDTPQGSANITSGSYTDGKISLKIDLAGNEITVTGLVKGDMINGEWEMAGQKGTIELKRVGGGAAPAAPAATTAPAAQPAAAGAVTGEWDASADVQGQAIPFTLILKADGDKVTGSSESAQGSVPITKGSITGDKISLTLDTPNGAITLNGVLKDGKIVGDFDFAGQFTGKWEAKKK